MLGQAGNPEEAQQWVELAGGITAGVGGLLLVIALIWGLRMLSFLRRSVVTTGTVTGIEERTSTDAEGGTSVAYAPVVEFTGADARKREFADPVASARFGRPTFKVGQAVPVRYDPDKPERARVGKRFRMWAGPATLVLVGGFLVPLGLFVMQLDV